jgi:hypothetical protein
LLLIAQDGLPRLRLLDAGGVVVNETVRCSSPGGSCERPVGKVAMRTDSWFVRDKLVMCAWLWCLERFERRGKEPSPEEVAHFY